MVYYIGIAIYLTPEDKMKSEYASHLSAEQNTKIKNQKTINNFEAIKFFIRR